MLFMGYASVSVEELSGGGSATDGAIPSSLLLLVCNFSLCAVAMVFFRSKYKFQKDQDY